MIFNSGHTQVHTAVETIQHLSKIHDLRRGLHLLGGKGIPIIAKNIGLNSHLILLEGGELPPAIHDILGDTASDSTQDMAKLLKDTGESTPGTLYPDKLSDLQAVIRDGYDDMNHLFDYTPTKEDDFIKSLFEDMCKTSQGTSLNIGEKTLTYDKSSDIITISSESADVAKIEFLFGDLLSQLNEDDQHKIEEAYSALWKDLQNEQATFEDERLRNWQEQTGVPKQVLTILTKDIGKMLLKDIIFDSNNPANETRIQQAFESNNLYTVKQLYTRWQDRGGDMVLPNIGDIITKNSIMPFFEKCGLDPSIFQKQGNFVTQLIFRNKRNSNDSGSNERIQKRLEKAGITTEEQLQDLIQGKLKISGIAEKTLDIIRDTLSDYVSSLPAEDDPELQSIKALGRISLEDVYFIGTQAENTTLQTLCTRNNLITLKDLYDYVQSIENTQKFIGGFSNKTIPLVKKTFQYLYGCIIQPYHKQLTEVEQLMFVDMENSANVGSDGNIKSKLQILGIKTILDLERALNGDELQLGQSGKKMIVDALFRFKNNLKVMPNRESLKDHFYDYLRNELHGSTLGISESFQNLLSSDDINNHLACILQDLYDYAFISLQGLENSGFVDKDKINGNLEMADMLAPTIGTTQSKSDIIQKLREVVSNISLKDIDIDDFLQYFYKIWDKDEALGSKYLYSTQKLHRAESGVIAVIPRLLDDEGYPLIVDDKPVLDIKKDIVLTAHIGDLLSHDEIRALIATYIDELKTLLLRAVK